MFPNSLSLNSKPELLILLYNSQITIAIRGGWTQSILSNGIDNCSPYEGLLPDYIYKINSHYKYSNVSQVTELVNGEKYITLEWEKPLISYSLMFNYMNNIAKIDASRFDTSRVLDMDYMFAYCTSLTSLNLNNCKTSSVTSMNDMFYKFESLISLNINHF